MLARDWAVIIAGLGLIGWVNWYFFLTGRTAGVAVGSLAMAGAGGAGTSASPVSVAIVVDGGYSPSTIRVKAGETVRLAFDRRDTGACSEEVVFPDFNIRRFLPSGQTTVIDITPAAPGRYEFMCGMSMLRGAVIAEA